MPVTNLITHVNVEGGEIGGGGCREAGVGSLPKKRNDIYETS